MSCFMNKLELLQNDPHYLTTVIILTGNKVVKIKGYFDDNNKYALVLKKLKRNFFANF
jgi:hypothetical protein